MHALLEQLCQRPTHVAVICGGAVSGSEAALACAEHGVTSIVIEQNARPYGKIEDGLPRWHDKLRAKEYHLIDESLARPNVLFVPSTKVGSDLAFETLLRDFGASTVLLANGRRLPSLRSSVDAGANAAVLPALSVASLVGFGAVVAALPAFTLVRDWVLGIGGGPLVSLAIATNILSALTGSASVAGFATSSE